MNRRYRLELPLSQQQQQQQNSLEKVKNLLTMLKTKILFICLKMEIIYFIVQI